MKKLLSVFTLAAICTFATSSFPTASPESEGFLPSISGVRLFSDTAPEAEEDKEQKKKQPSAGHCCQHETENAQCSKLKKNNFTTSTPPCSGTNECISK